MMRRGPLDRYPVEWVLRQASTSRASGCIQFHGPEPMTVFVDDGEITAVVAGISAEDPGLLDAILDETDEDRARHAAVTVLATRVAGRVGWYYHDPLEHGLMTPWSWPVASLLTDARNRGRDDRSMAEWDGRHVGLRSTGEGITLSADGLAIVATLAQTLSASELRVRLGWEGTRLAAALIELDRSGALSLHGTRPVHDLDATIRAAEAVLAAADEAQRAVQLDLTAAEAAAEVTASTGPRRVASAVQKGPLTPPPILAASGSSDFRNGLRRLRASRR